LIIAEETERYSRKIDGSGNDAANISLEKNNVTHTINGPAG